MRHRAIGIFGGTFDPVHFGHIRTSLSLRERLPLEEIRYIPANAPPHRPAPHAAATQRWHMLTTVLSGIPGVTADDRELRREGLSYTVDTLEDLRAEFGEAVRLCLIVGTDAFAALDTWHRWEDLMTLCHLIVMRRPGAALPRNGAVATALDRRRLGTPDALLDTPGGGILPWSVPQIDISSSVIRACIAAGRQPRYLLPGSVWAYICRAGLYGARNVPGCG